MRYLLAFLFVFSLASVAQADSPFCVESSAGRVCEYYDGPSCRSAAADAGGKCVLNTKVSTDGKGILASPFCVVTKDSRQCDYQEEKSCKIAAEKANGTCVANE